MKRWSTGLLKATRKGTKQFGVTLWGNSSRFGWQINFWRWEFQTMWERKK